MERGWRITHCFILCSLMTLSGGRTKSTWRSRVLRRFSGIQVELCAVLLGCTVTCLRELGDCTDTSRVRDNVAYELLGTTLELFFLPPLTKKITHI